MSKSGSQKAVREAKDEGERRLCKFQRRITGQSCWAKHPTRLHMGYRKGLVKHGNWDSPEHLGRLDVDKERVRRGLERKPQVLIPTKNLA